MKKHNTGLKPSVLWSKLSLEEQIVRYSHWQQKGLSQLRFCKQHGLSLEEFSAWRTELHQSESSFCEVRCMEPEYRKQDSSIHLELAFPNQVSARIEATSEQITLLIREVLYATAALR